MGGEASGCDENTTDVLIKSALWNEINIAQSGRNGSRMPLLFDRELLLGSW